MAESVGMGFVPTKPPRGQKTGRETGILMTVIKALLSSASPAQRDAIKSQVEQEYKQIDKTLDGLILNKQDSLNNVMQAFRHVCDEIYSAKQRLHGVKSNLQKCKMLLHCRREELERLWLEGIEHKHALEILEQIDQLRNVPQQFSKAIGRKQYLQASETLMSSLNTWNDSLEQIEGLREVRVDLKAKKEKLYEILFEELNAEIFTKSAPTVVEIKRQGSGVFSPFQRSSSDRQSSGRTRMNQIKARRIYLDVSTASGSSDIQKSSDGQDIDAFMSVIVKCMILLEELPKFVEDLKSQLEEKLLGAVSHISQQMIEYTDSNGISEANTPMLLEFLELTFSQFRTIVQYHTKLLHLIKAAETGIPGSTSQEAFTEEDLWAKLQLVLQSTLKIYFDLSDSKSNQISSSASPTFRNESAMDINSYFFKKKQARQKKIPLFKFEYSLHGLNVGEYGVDTLVERSAMDKHRFLVCQPDPRNIIVIYNAVHEFILEIEQALDSEKCDLRKFMAINVNRVFVQQIYKEISESVEAAKKNPDSWRDVISLEETKALCCVQPILQSVAQIGRSILEVISLAKDLPSHCDQLIRILDAVLTSYKDICQAEYSSMVSPDDRKLISVTMVNDEDIERLLKSLPNWAKLLKRKDIKALGNSDESPEDASSQNIRESDLFFGLFGGKTLQSHEILHDIKLIEQIAHLQESMEWFAESVASVAGSFQVQCSHDPELREPIDKIRSLGLAFHEISETCLILLYLEVRVHSFFYLSPIPQKGEFAPGVDSQATDPDVVQFSKDLSDIETVLSACLQPTKFKFVFEGLGQLISTVLIRGAQDVRRINENGVKKMCRNIFSIQQTLCNITNQPEHALDHARQYYELFLHPVEELFDTILEKGPQFKELEYMSAVQLQYRSKPGSCKEPLSEYLNRLSNILGDVGVTV